MRAAGRAEREGADRAGAKPMALGEQTALARER
jgi:hypothetical protein